MKKLALITLSLAALLAGCDTMKGSYPPKGPDPEKPKVTVVNGQIRVDQTVIAFEVTRKPVTITWSLPEGGPYRFPLRNGIVFEGQVTDELLRGDKLSVVLDPKQNQFGNCIAHESRLRYTCVNRGTQAGVFKYTIRVTEGDKELPPLDPMAVNW
jgi:hypothetical protein